MWPTSELMVAGGVIKRHFETCLALYGREATNRSVGACKPLQA
jgi:hypothetical protein